MSKGVLNFSWCKLPSEYWYMYVLTSKGILIKCALVSSHVHINSRTKVCHDVKAVFKTVFACFRKVVVPAMQIFLSRYSYLQYASKKRFFWCTAKQFFVSPACSSKYCTKRGSACVINSLYTVSQKQPVHPMVLYQRSRSTTWFNKLM